MKYSYRDLGEQQEGSTVVVRMRGNAANVTLLDAVNFPRYRSGEPFVYHGGHFQRTPVRIDIPHDGHWYVAVDLGGFKGRVQWTVDVLPPDGSPRESESKAQEAEAADSKPRSRPAPRTRSDRSPARRRKPSASGRSRSG